MTPLRDKFEQARDAYEGARYPGNLALDVIGTAKPSNGPRWLMAIAASVALLGGTAYLVTRFDATPSPGEDVAVNRPLTKAPEEAAPDDITPRVAPDVAVATGDPENGATQTDETFTLVPTLESFADASGTSEPMNLTLSVPDSPMLFSLSALSEQGVSESEADEPEAENRS